MKSRKKLKHVELVQEVIQQVKSRFPPKIPDIKKNIDALMEKDYIERLDGDELSYIAWAALPAFPFKPWKPSAGLFQLHHAPAAYGWRNTFLTARTFSTLSEHSYFWWFEALMCPGIQPSLSISGSRCILDVPGKNLGSILFTGASGDVGRDFKCCWVSLGAPGERQSHESTKMNTTDIQIMGHQMCPVVWTANSLWIVVMCFICS